MHHLAALLLALRCVRYLLHIVVADVSVVTLDHIADISTFLLPAGAKPCSTLTKSGKHTVRFVVSFDLQVHGMGGALGVWWYSLAAKEGFVHELYGEALAVPTAVPCLAQTSPLCAACLHL